MPAKSEKQARLFRAALGSPKKGTRAAKIKASLSKSKIKDFTKLKEFISNETKKILTECKYTIL